MSDGNEILTWDYSVTPISQVSLQQTIQTIIQYILGVLEIKIKYPSSAMIKFKLL